MTGLTLKFFGSPRIIVDNELIHIGRRKAIALLAYLALTERRHSRAHLAALLWPDYNEADARSELRRALSTLNQAIGAERLDADRQSVALTGSSELAIDVLAFRQIITRTRHSMVDREALGAAVTLAKDYLLAGFQIDDAPGFEEWLRFEAESLRRELAWALEQLSQLHVAVDQLVALDYASRWLALDPLDEAAHRRHMELYATAGDTSAAYRQYQACKEVLMAELGALPSAETVALYERIYAGDYPSQTAAPSNGPATAPANGSPPPPTVPSPNLPAQLTPFVGRSYELQALRELLHGNKQGSGDHTTDDQANNTQAGNMQRRRHRLITLIGPGGIGKTRLALQVAWQESATTFWQDGVYFIEFGAVETPELLPTTLADGLQATLAGNQPLLDQLLHWLQAKQMLIVLDNLEQFLTAEELPRVATIFTRLLQQAPQVTMLVTSRTRLNLHGETLFHLLAMPFPTTVNMARPGEQQGIDNRPDPTLVNYDAIQLFCRSAQRADHTFELTAANQEDVLQICQLVQGMPLALDLAASWVRMLSCAEIAAEIRQSLEFLAATAHNLPARHRSISAVIESSWQLLSTPEQALMRRLAVFRDGFTRTAAQAVAGATLPLLISLVDRSFLWLDANQRFRRHPMLLQFSQEQLAANLDEKRQAEQNHVRYFTEFIEQCERELKGGNDAQVLRTMRADVENLRAAWYWLLEQEALDLIARFCPGLDHYFQRSGEFAQGYTLFAAAVKELAHLPLASDALVWIHCAHGSLAVRTGENTLAAQILDRCIVAAEQLQNRHLQALTRYRAGVNADYQGHYDRALDYLEEAIRLGQELDDPYLLGSIYNSLAIVEWMQDQLDPAEEHALQSLTYAQALNNEISVAMRLSTLGSIAYAKKEYERAIGYTEQSYQRFVARNHLWGIGTSLHNLANAWGALGEHEKALAMKLEATGYEHETGHKWDLAVNHCSIAATLVELNRLSEAIERVQTGIALAGIEMAQVTVYGLGILGKVAAHQGKLTEAIALLLFAMQHPAMAGYIADELRETLDDLRSEALPTVLAEAEQQANRWTLGELVATYGVASNSFASWTR